MKRGYFGIGIFHTKTEANVGTLWRSAYSFGADFIFTIGRRYRKQASDTVNAARHVPCYHYEDMDDFLRHRPYNCPLVGIEQCEGSVRIENFCHPERAIYLLGSEDGGLSAECIRRSQYLVEIDTAQCINVATAGSILMFDRQQKIKRSHHAYVGNTIR